MNTYTIHDARLVDDPEEINTKAGNKLVKIRLADNPISDKNGATPRYVDCLLGRPDLMETALRLEKGDVISIWGNLQRREYTSNGKGKTPAGVILSSDEMPFVDGFRVQRSPSFFERAAGNGATAAPPVKDTSIPF